MPTLIVVDNKDEWPFEIPGVDVVEARAYLNGSAYNRLRGVKLFNLCRSYRYQSLGYYVTLSATARGHTPLPDLTSIQDMKSQTVVRFVSDDLDELIQKTLAPIQSNRFTLSIYFGRNLAKRYDRLSLHLFNLFQAPLLRAHFAKNGKWQLKQIGPIPVGEIPDRHRSFVLHVSTEHFAGRYARVRKPAQMKYDLAMLVNSSEESAPSDNLALRRFIRAGESLGIGVEVITRDDYGRLAEFDALFIRETTRVNHYTYRFARRAAMKGMPVIDDPESILKCSNKVYLAELLERHEVPIPRTIIVHRDNVQSIGQDLGFPCILKQPDAAFSQGVVKVTNQEELLARAEEFLGKSELVVAQEYLPTPFDWRVGVLNRRPLYVCKYHMAPKHWQIIKREGDGRKRYGKSDTVPLDQVPRRVLQAAVRAANLIGDGLYGVDLKEVNGQPYVIEVNDNPNIDSGVEDRLLKHDLYVQVMQEFLDRLERKRSGKTSA